MLKFFAEKMWVAFAKATHIFSAKNIRILCIQSAKTVNEMILNELVKLTTLWTTGPSLPSVDSDQIMLNVSLYMYIYHSEQFNWDDNLMLLFFLFFLFFTEKIEFDISCKLYPKETICMKCKILLGKNTITLSAAEFAKRMISVKAVWSTKLEKNILILITYLEQKQT